MAPMDLCLSLIRADSEDEVVQILDEAGYWDDPGAWRFYGDYENNYNTIGNQQSRPDAALVEKLINAVDARLLNECLSRAIDPEGDNAPRSIRQAVAEFFHPEFRADNPQAGQISAWPDAKRTEIARGITLCATGMTPQQGNPCFTVSDNGEGQTPKRIPDTFLSLTKSNKLRIPFVQGKFNMGGTGALQFCGRLGLQLLLSRRNPEILKLQDDCDEFGRFWGFTIVRREDPHGGRRSSVYTYLAPIAAETNPNRGGVIPFAAESMPIFPDGRQPYGRLAEWGTLIKLYEYAATGFKSNIILSRPSLLNRMDLLLPDVALPIRLHECRPTYRGHAGSFETTLTGLAVRLDDDRGRNIEDGFPSSCPLAARGEQMTATIYAFKKDKAETYRKHEGIIFTLNGQTHGHLTPDFFGKAKVGLRYLADSILVIVDCSRFSGRAREDLFMNSRDRLSGGDLRKEIEDQLEDILKQHPGLRELKERRRREETEARLADSKPLEEILKSILRNSPSLANLFLAGKRASNPFKTRKVQQGDRKYEGKRFPTYFKIKGLVPGTTLLRETPQNMRARITFETDAQSDYFGRESERGEFSLSSLSDSGAVPVANYVGPNLHEGIATLSVEHPSDSKVGDEVSFLALVIDPSRIEPFENRFTVRVKPPDHPAGKRRKPRKPPVDQDGRDREVPSGISLPNIVKVYEADWETYTPHFDKFTALRIKNAGFAQAEETNGGSKSVYDFHLNLDNLYLKTEMKPAGRDAEVTRARFMYGMVLVGLALLQQEDLDRKSLERKESDNDNDNDDDTPNEAQVNIEQQVEQFTKALAPVLLPLIESLGDLDDEGTVAFDGTGDAT